MIHAYELDHLVPLELGGGSYRPAQPLAAPRGMEDGVRTRDVQLKDAADNAREALLAAIEDLS
jgi:hypothetical protein